MPESGGVSRFNAEAALLWRCMTKTRYPDLKRVGDGLWSRLRIPVGLRETLGGIPGDFPGNVFLNSITEMPLDVLVAETDGRADGRRIAPLIRASIQAVQDVDLARRAIRLAHHLPEHGMRRALFSYTTVQDLFLSSWGGFSLYLWAELGAGVRLDRW